MLRQKPTTDWKRLELPTALGLHQIGHALGRVGFFPEEEPAGFVLSFNPRKQNLDPLGVSALAAWANYWSSRNVPIVCENMTGSGPLYAQRMGLFKFIPGAPERLIAQHESAGRFVELRRISTQDDLSQLCAELGGLLRVPYLIEITNYFVAEMARNALEHAGAPAFVCAQYYMSDKRVSIGVADCGCGVKASLRTNHGFARDEDAIIAALRPGISGATSRPYSAPNNAGLGLFYARGISLSSERQFGIVSGTAGYKLLPSQERSTPSHDPTKDNHRIIKVKPWQGTLVGLSIRGDHGKPSAFLSRMRTTLNIGSGMRSLPRVNFT